MNKIPTREQLEQNSRVDRSLWPAGPWDSEPDRKDWKHRGLSCLALRNHSGTWCGYVAIPAGHPYREATSMDSPLSDPMDSLLVHGGITYASKCDGGRICHVPDDEDDDVLWVGFDCGHIMDLSPADVANGRLLGLSSPPRSYRTLEFVIAEVEGLAIQIAEAA